jgi:hypothetical protein
MTPIQELGLILITGGIIGTIIIIYITLTERRVKK